MDGGERKEEEASLPPDYVSLAQLQERWLRRKQEELELKQKREEEEKREREAKARAQDEGDRNRSGPAKMAGGFVRETGAVRAVQDKGKGKEIVSRGPGNGGDGDYTRRKNGRREERRFPGAEKKEGVGVGAEVLSGGDGRGGVKIAAGGVGRAGILSREGGSGGDSGVVEVLPRNGEVADAKRTDLRGGLRGNGRNHGEPALVLEEDENGGGKKWLERGRGGGRGRGSGSDRNGVNELRQTEPAVNLEKKDEEEHGRGKKWRGRERGGNGVNELKESEPEINLKDVGQKGTVRVNEWKQSEAAISLKEGGEKLSGTKWLQRGGQRGRNEVNDLKKSEPELYLKEEEGVENGSGGVHALKQSEPSMNLAESEKGHGKKWRARERDRNGVNELKQSDPTINVEKEKEGEQSRDKKWKGRVRGSGGNGLNELKQAEVVLDLEKEEEDEKGHDKKYESGRGRNGVNELKQSELTIYLEKEKDGEKGRNKKRKGRFRVRGRNEVNELKQSEAALDLEKEEEGEKGHGKKWIESGRQKNGVNELKPSEVELDLEKDEEGVRGGGKKLRGGGRTRCLPKRINRLKEFRPVVAEGSEVDSEVKNKAEDEISELCSEITSLSVGDANGIQGQDNKAKDDEDGAEGKGLNGLKVAVEIEKKVDHEVLSRKCENRGYGREYPINGNRRGGFRREYPRNGIKRGGFGRGRRYTWSQKPDGMNSMEMVNMVWVKKEDKLDA